MNKLYFLLFLSVASCNPKTIHYARFDMNNMKIDLSGLSDINSEFYSHNFPDYHTPEKIRQNRLKNTDVYCGRITNSLKNQMVELFIQYPDRKELKIKDILDIKGDTIWTLSSKKGNYDNQSHRTTDKYARFYFFNQNKEYTSSGEPNDGFLYLEKVDLKTDSTAMIKGNFDFEIREYGKNENTNIKGGFNLEFYIGL